MFALFYTIYYSMFIGSWNSATLSINQIGYEIQDPIKKIIEVITNMFNNTTTPVTDFTLGAIDYLRLASFVLALITSIGIVVMAVKGIKRVFGVFFMSIR